MHEKVSKLSVNINGVGDEQLQSFCECEIVMKPFMNSTFHIHQLKVIVEKNVNERISF